jgi:ATP-dependent exoDNAse (exonuclease V) beta subunit
MTFTNAATAEMKDRILRELKYLSEGSDSAEHAGTLKENHGLSTEELQRSASGILRAMMEDYSGFAITTIDSFFQRILRVFTREIGLNQGYEVELDTDKVLERVMDELLADLTVDSPAMYWIEHVLEERWNEGKSNNFRRDLLELGGELFKEGVHQKLAQENLGSLREKGESVYADMENIEGELATIQEEVKGVLDHYGLTFEDFSGKKRSFIGTWLKTYSDPYKIIKKGPEGFRKILSKNIDEVDLWTAKSAPSDTVRKIESASDEINRLLKTTVQWIDDRLPVYFSLYLIRKKYTSYGFLAILNDYVQSYCQREQKVLLSDTSEMLKEVVRIQIMPFFYERIGERYQHILLDEFQDTSTSQWEVLDALVEELVATGTKDSLVVGDVKQAIYRWRNGNWQILQLGLQQKYEPLEQYQPEQLENNWRSREEIVSFNNELYGDLAELAEGELLKAFSKYGIHQREEVSIIGDIFSGHAQDIHEKMKEARAGGFVCLDGFLEPHKATGIEKAEQEVYFFDLIKERIVSLKNRGFSKSDICILVRGGKEALEISEYLLEWQREDNDTFTFTSPQALELSNSYIVQGIMAFFKLIIGRDEKVARLEWDQAVEKIPSTELSRAALDDMLREARAQSLWEIAERVVEQTGWAEVVAELPFLLEFQNQVLQYVDLEQGHIRDWVDFYYDREIFRNSIILPDNQDAIRVMTIHKSKGMEYPVVLLPYMDMDITAVSKGMNKTIIWAEPFAIMDRDWSTYPLEFGKQLAFSTLSDEFAREFIAQWVDTLNLCYVATTRPQQEVHLFLKGVEPNNELKLLSQLLWSALDHNRAQDIQSEVGHKRIVRGIPVEHRKTEDDKEEGNELYHPIELGDYRGARPIPSISDPGSGLQEEEENNALSRGRKLHEILERVYDEESLNRSITAAIEQGILVEEERSSYFEALAPLMNHSEIGPLLRLKEGRMVERELLVPGSVIQRPDRVIRQEGRTLVIDFKTGKKYPAHRDQVQNYMESLMEMQAPAVEGYLVYIDAAEMERVELS